MSILAQPRQLEMVARRVKILNNDLDRLTELKSGRKDTTNTLSFGLPSTINPQNTSPADTSKDASSNDSETKVKVETFLIENRLFTFSKDQQIVCYPRKS